MIKIGAIEAGIAGGVELLSDYPIRYNRKVNLIYIYINFFFFIIMFYR